MENGGFAVVPKNSSKRINLWSVLLLNIASVGGIISLLKDISGVRIPGIVMIIVTVVCSVGCVWLVTNTIRYIFGILSVALVTVIICLFAGNAFVAGGLDMINGIIARYNYISGMAQDYYALPEYVDMNMAYIIFTTVLTIYSSLLIVELIYRKHPYYLMLMWMPVLLAAIYLKTEVNAVSIVMNVVSVVGTLAYSHTELKNDLVYMVSGVFIYALVAVAGLLYVNSMSDMPSGKVDSVKNSIVDVCENIRYGKSDYPEGKIEEEVITDSDVKLKLNVSSMAKVYLKGYTASDYNMGEWSSPEGTNYSGKYEGMINEYVKDGYHPLSGQSCFIDEAEKEGIEGLSKERISIEVVNESASTKYMYMPYGVTFESLEHTGRAYQDINVSNKFFTKNNNTYSFDVDYTGQDYFITHSDYAISEYDFCNVEADYRAYVYDHYCTANEDDLYDSSLCVDNKYGVNSLTDITNEIRTKLSEIPEEFVCNWKSVQYAGNGTLMYRLAGIPARYVEGYLAVGNGNVEVTGTDAHAWTEIYIDNIGWVPVDVTPGFYDDLENMNNSATDSDGNIGEMQDNEQPLQGEMNISMVNKTMWWILLLIIIAVFIICIDICILLIREKVVFRKRCREMETTDIIRRVIIMAGYMKNVAAYLQINDDDLPKKTKDILSALWYSNNSSELIGESEELCIKHTFDDLQQQVWSGRRWYDKLYIKYILCLRYPA